jgi:hypothetical protein
MDGTNSQAMLNKQEKISTTFGSLRLMLTQQKPELNGLKPLTKPLTKVDVQALNVPSLLKLEMHLSISQTSLNGLKMKSISTSTMSGTKLKKLKEELKFLLMALTLLHPILITSLTMVDAKLQSSQQKLETIL